MGMAPSLLLILAPLLFSQGTPSGPPAGARSPAIVSIDGAWAASGGVLFLSEGAGGRLFGYLGGDPGTQLISGTRAGSAVDLAFQSADGGGPLRPGLFSGTFSGASLRGTFDDGSGPVPMTLSRFSGSLLEEHWLLVDAGGSGAQVEAARLSRAGHFFGGGFRGLENCDFLACGGIIDAWTVTGISHLIETSSSGPCPTSSTLTGTLDGATKMLSGALSTSDCAGTTLGTFLGGKGGLTQGTHIQEVLELITDLCTALETESPTAIDAFHTSYLHDGRTRADFAAEFANWFADYHSLEATVVLERIITIDDGEIVPFLSGPNRLDWQLNLTGIPNAGSTREILLDYAPAPFDDGAHYLGMEGSRRVFVGNDELVPFSLDMPIAAGDGAFNNYGIWPYGVHGGNHPEGHGGIDIEFAGGANTLAVADGVILFLGPNSNFPARYDILLEARPGVVVQYDHMGAPDPAVFLGATVTRGQVLGSDPNPIHVHLAVRAAGETTCPTEHFTPAGQAVFNSLWSNASYREELVEPLRCNSLGSSFPLTASRSRITGSLSAAQIEFTRLDASTDAMTYNLLDGTGTVFESGIVSHLHTASSTSELDLTPTSPAGPTRFGLMDIVGPDLWIDWDTLARPANLSGASHYILD